MEQPKKGGLHCRAACRVPTFKSAKRDWPKQLLTRAAQTCQVFDRSTELYS